MTAHPTGAESTPRTRRNRPLDRVHDIDKGYGRLLIPWRGHWLGWRESHDGSGSLVIRDGRYVREPRSGGFAMFKVFHNCTATGVH